ncbi:leucyl-tRNA synthetase [Saccharopolyspora erythraea NRRL 2338]|uniref:Leucine--tRNA ligase n=2 Tax=Saccharopolyspora erythraea TaxID=1836 RepID=SYL_SACEN|nr:leucine--tRNA ligase [Saccharopolyspora erythraea]A4FR54.1 RecName: Full=Leucine--tRNA ligase; AltName: Full=Leucyl-tRNA synthetase; Short=LeuRS [Saccharopolyspora erythraea NRRL 2338]EQD87968.1 leucyl-tRNA synthetase [Saccharopolyspora erythraea D]PFG93130.1 leucyl-tRNA synthetase [Saccharopolyspora erythraea NRRL 2338]QRK89998.1 leucine--tRNA ligase [Saccharopolyspora erythraea]CAM06529.1 leucyl-tRNA synthetase [Saccharopolyspora erythraea NRRL 2338]
MSGQAEGSTNTEEVPRFRYTAQTAAEIEQRWQRRWEELGTFHAPNPAGSLKGEVSDEKLFVQDMFPYPSGSGLHVGHPLGFIGTDVYARFNRMLGKNVLHTMGFDSFGLPAEQYAVQTGTHPRTTTEKNIERYLTQIRRLGLGHDERRRVATTDIPFYRWTQWIFLQIFHSWYDTDADRARPISELEAQFAAGERATPDGRPWAELSRTEQRRIIDSYRLVYLSEAPVNWAPGLGTVVANEEVTADGLTERGNFPVFRRNLKQWMMRITAYADRLIDDLDRLDWPDKIKTMQRNWIGRSQGANVVFPLDGSAGSIEVFTTRPDTLFGVTYLVLAPEHPLVDELTAAQWPQDPDLRWTGGAATPAEAVAQYRRAASMKSDLDRQENKEKTGVFTGAWATNPVNGEQVPVFIADYVLMGYGTGAIMAVPGEDQRDFDFAEAFGLPVVRTVQPSEGFEGGAYSGEGPRINSANPDVGLDLNGMHLDEAKKTIIEWLESHKHGSGTVQYKLRDWLFARQRYWGEPFPVVYDSDGIPLGLPESELPVVLPEVADYSPRTFDPEDADSRPEPPLAKATEWANVELDLGDGLKNYERDTNVMPQWAGSCWYQLRYIDPDNDQAFVDPANERYWMGKRPELHGPDDPGGLDLYIGGVEHGVLHLLYSRFWHKVLYDLGHVSSEEPYRRLYNQGYIQAYAYTDSRGVYVPAEEVEERDGKFFFQGEEVRREYGKMGKSLKNSVSPDEMADAYGADTLRLYEMAMGPLDASRPWATKDVVGSHRFLQRLWRNVVDENTGELRVTDDEPAIEVLRALHKTIAGVREDYRELRFNTAVAKLIELNNLLTKEYSATGAPRAVVGPLVLMVAPLAPHMAEELWSKLGHDGSLAHGPFPEADEQYLVEDTVEYPIQFNGKVRSRIVVPASAGQDEVKAAALADEKVVAALDGREPRKVIVVPGRLVNVVG